MTADDLRDLTTDDQSDLDYVAGNITLFMLGC